MGWVKASALGVGDCNFTHDVTQPPTTVFCRHHPSTSLYLSVVFCFRTSSIRVSTLTMENSLSLFPVVSLSYFLVFCSFSFSVSPPRYAFPCFLPSISLTDNVVLTLTQRLGILPASSWNRNRACSDNHRLIVRCWLEFSVESATLIAAGCEPEENRRYEGLGNTREIHRRSSRGDVRDSVYRWVIVWNINASIKIY